MIEVGIIGMFAVVALTSDPRRILPIGVIIGMLMIAGPTVVWMLDGGRLVI